MRNRARSLLLCLAALATFDAGGAASAKSHQPWGYRIGVTRPPQQANFCDQREDALEIAQIFERFGARTGFSALSNAPNCSRRVHGVTPRALLQQVRIRLEDGGEYFVNFILVRAEDGSEPVLVTTRRLLRE